MVGDQSDIAGRLRGYLPRWFGTTRPTPVLDSLLTGFGVVFAAVYDLIVFARQQARIATSSGAWLDITAYSFLGDKLPRFHLEADPAYRDRIRREIFRDRNTRRAGIDILTELTGSVPFVYEGWYGPVCGGYGDLGLAYGRVGRYASRGALAQVIFHVPLPQNYGIPNRVGYGSLLPGGAAAGGLGHIFSFVDDSEITGRGPSQIEILQRLESVRTDGVDYFVTFTAPPGH